MRLFTRKPKDKNKKSKHRDMASGSFVGPSSSQTNNEDDELMSELNRAHSQSIVVSSRASGLIDFRAAAKEDGR